MVKLYGIYDEEGYPVHGRFVKIGDKTDFEWDDTCGHIRAGTRGAIKSKAKIIFGKKRKRHLHKGAWKKDGKTGEREVVEYKKENEI